MKEITSRDNSEIKEYVKLKSSKSAREMQGLFTIEGVKICLEAFYSNIEILKVFVKESLLSKDERVRNALKNHENVFLINDSIEQKLSDTKTPQGIFCVCKRLDKDFDLDTIYKGKLFVMLCGIQDPGNMGTIIRTADGLAVDGIILTSDCCDIYNPKVVRSTMGSLARIKIKTVEDKDDFLEDISKRTNTIAAVLDDGAVPPQNLKRDDKPCVLVIGNEGNGLPEHTVSLCKQKTMIPMRSNAESFNAAVAAAILMWELIK